MTAPAPARMTRRVFSATAATGVALAATHAMSQSRGSAQGGTPAPAATADWEQFDRSLEAAMQTFDMVGAAISVVAEDEVAYSRSFGARNLATGEPVTPDTHFLVASTTKSMTALLAATFVDEGVIGWDQPVREIYPDFRAPTDELTENLRVRDMLDMASCIGEPDAMGAFHQGDPTPPQLLNLIENLPVIGPTGSQFFYNGTVYASGGYLPALALGTDPGELGGVYARQMEERVYRPTGMTTARIADDPRPFTDNYATGYGVHLTLGNDPQPYAPVGSYAPAGGTLATQAEMTSYVMMQLNRGVASDGTRLASSENLEECWAVNVDIPVDAAAAPDVERSGYGMGWIHFTFRDGRRFITHTGGIDGFTTVIGIMPDDGLGLVVNTNMNPPVRGLTFIQYVSALFLEMSSLNKGAADGVVAQYEAANQGLEELGAQTEPVDESTIGAWLGFYEKGWQLAFEDDGTLQLKQSSRSIPLLAMPDGDYVMATGVAPGNIVRFSSDESGTPRMELIGLETVRWTTG